MGKVMSFINMKGGVGKTTLAVNVGYTLSRKFSKKVVLIDMDPQMNATQYTLKEDQIEEIMKDPKKSIYGILSEEYNLPSVMQIDGAPTEVINPIFEISDNFDLIPSHLKIMAINLDESPYRLRQYIEDTLRNKYDIIIIDSPPTISSYTKVSLLASDMYVVPMKTDFLSFFGLPLLESYIGRIKREFGKDIYFLGIILTMVRPDWKIYRIVKEKLEQQPQWRNKLFNIELKYRTIVARALSPEERESKSQYILDLGDRELEEQIVQITEELLRRGRI